ncbi:MAG: SUMF1/EgtB/PvdO family nonheme iron enzyme [Pseudomonadota bacterium]|nr:SUMF1/EgtB/PvdO family nonheme iron enzyme [Pseudomonadota bacterium]
MEIPGYTIIRELGSGGMATVYLASQDRLNRQVALKVMKPIPTEVDDFTERFFKEGQIIAQLQHRQIITIYDLNTYGHIQYFSMEYLPGGTLSEKIEEGLPVERTLEIIKGVAEALSYAHERGIIHRDVKPQNILFRQDGTPVLTDFGIARVVRADADTTRLTRLGMVIGSPRYMSPEQITSQPLDARSDLYSLGIVFYEMLTKSLPYEAEDAISLAMKHCSEPVPALPKELRMLQSVLDKLVAKKPDDRFDSAGHLIRALEQIDVHIPFHPAIDDETRVIPPDKYRYAARGRKPIRSKKGLFIIGVILLTATAGGAVYFLIKRDAPLPQPEISIGLPPAQEGRSSTAINYERLAIGHFQRGEYEQSLELTKLGLGATPEDPRLLTLRGRVQKYRDAAESLVLAREQYDKGALERSLQLIEKGLKQLPQDDEMLSLRDRVREQLDERRAEQLLAQARSRRQAGDLDGTLDLIEEGLERVPDQTQLLRLRDEIRKELAARRAEELLAQARARRESGDLDGSLKLINEGLEISPRQKELTALRASVQAQVEQKDQVKKLFGEAQGLQRRNALDESLEVIEQGLRLAPDHAGLLKLRTLVQNQQSQRREEMIADTLERAREEVERGSLEESLKLIENGLVQAPDRPELLALRDRVWTQLDRRQKIARLLAQARESRDKGRLDESLKLIDQALQLAPEQTDLLSFREKANVELDHRNRIAQHLQDCATRFALDELPEDSGEAAAACYGSVLELDASNEEALARLGQIADLFSGWVKAALLENDLEKAENFLERLGQLNPDHPKLSELRRDLSAVRREILPAMVAIDGDCYQMGSPPNEEGREDDERQHKICVNGFRLGKYEVTVKEFRRFVEATGYRTDAERNEGGEPGCSAFDQSDKESELKYRSWASWRKPNQYEPTREDHPVTCVSWNDAQAYIAWLNGETGGHYRLPTEAEWEYAARAGTTTARFWGDSVDGLACLNASVADTAHDWADGFPCDDVHEWVAPSGRFRANPWGLHDMLGNVWEWTCSVYDKDYRGAEAECAGRDSDVPRVLRGGSWYSGPKPVRSAYRDRNFPEVRYSFLGFRLAQD